LHVLYKATNKHNSNYCTIFNKIKRKNSNTISLLHLLNNSLIFYKNLFILVKGRRIKKALTSNSALIPMTTLPITYVPANSSGNAPSLSAPATSMPTEPLANNPNLNMLC